MTILLLLGLGLLAGCAALLGRAAALPRMRATERLGQIAAYGFAAQAPDDEASRPGGAVEGLAGRIGGVARRLGTFSPETLQRELMAAGMYGTAPVTLLGYRVICAFGFAATTLWLVSVAGYGGPIGLFACFVMVMFGWLGPLTFVRRRARDRLQMIDYELPELVDVLVVTVESGLGFASSIQLAAERFEGPLGDELRLAFQEQAMGLPTQQALGNILSRSDTPAMRSFVRSVRQGESLGVSIGQIMRNLAVEMRKRRYASAEERAQKAPIKILFPLVGLIFPAIFVVLLAPAILSFTSSVGGGS